ARVRARGSRWRTPVRQKAGRRRWQCAWVDSLGSGKLQRLDADIAEPQADRRGAFVLGSLQCDVAVVVAGESGPVRELGLRDAQVPGVGPQLGVDRLVSVLEELYVAVVDADLDLVPLS